jgi:hypothetical protein
MQLLELPHKRLIGAAVLACAAALIPAAARAATGAPAAPTPAAVSAGFQPTSASFYSPGSGVVLGGVGCTSGHACLAQLVATTDSGARWHFLTAPDVSLSTISQVAFASRRDGWLYGARLWATHDGGARWQRISLPGDVLTVAASAGTVYAVVSRSTVDELFRPPAGRDAWTRVRHFTGNFGAALAVSGKAAWFGTSTVGAHTYLWATADGVHWHKYPFTCPGADYGLSGIAAASPSRVAFLCANAEGMFHTAKEVLHSVNGGKTEHLTGHAPLGGDVPGYGAFAVPPGRPRVVTIAVYTPGPDYVYRSANGGKTWAQIAIRGTEGGPLLGSLTYASPTVGFVVVSWPPRQLLRTSDAGATWHKVSIPAAPASPVTAYVADGGNGTVTPINTATNKTGKPIQTGLGAHDIAITPNGKTVYVPNPPTGTVTPINTTTNKAGKPIPAAGTYIAITP